jgi:hypothetical protein
LLAGTASGAAPAVTMSGPHANEEFCKTMVRQVELFGQFVNLDPISPDMTKRAKYFTDQKDLNATLVKTVPTLLASDVALTTKNANASSDAQLARDSARIKATAAPLRSPEHLAAYKRMKEYCGARL